MTREKDVWPKCVENWIVGLMCAFLLVVMLGLIGMSTGLFSVMKWIGRRDVTIEFVVSDAIDGRKVPDATISLDGQPDSSRPPMSNVLRTDSSGSARILLVEQTCTGTRGWGIDDMHVYPPGLTANVEAAGYENAKVPLFESPAFRGPRPARQDPVVISLFISLRPVSESN